GARVATVAAACAVTVGAIAVASLAGGNAKRSESTIVATSTSTTSPTNETTRTSARAPAPTTTTLSPTTSVSSRPSDTTRLQLVHSIGGTISPKSVVASGSGLVLAQNMMYQHSITVYSSTGDLVTTIP